MRHTDAPGIGRLTPLKFPASRPVSHGGEAEVRKGTLADVDREVRPEDIIQFDQAEAFEVFGVGRNFRGFAGASEGSFAA
jgi:hypothetical protein